MWHTYMCAVALSLLMLDQHQILFGIFSIILFFLHELHALTHFVCQHGYFHATDTIFQIPLGRKHMTETGSCLCNNLQSQVFPLVIVLYDFVFKLKFWGQFSNFWTLQPHIKNINFIQFSYFLIGNGRRYKK